MQGLTILLCILALGVGSCGDDEDNPAGANDADLRIRLTAQDWHGREDNTLSFADDGTCFAE